MGRQHGCTNGTKTKRESTYVWECEMKTREEEDKWEALLHQYDLLLHSYTLGKLNIPE